LFLIAHLENLRSKLLNLTGFFSSGFAVVADISERGTLKGALTKGYSGASSPGKEVLGEERELPEIH
jgi:hypothetical protein